MGFSLLVSFTTLTANAENILPPEYGALVIRPVQSGSIAFRGATVIDTTSHEYRVPIVAADPQAAWVAEGEEIAQSIPEMAGLIVVPRKVAGLSVVSREMVDDSNPAAAQIVGDGLARDIVRRIDEAFFGKLPLPAPPGLESLPGVTAVNAGTAWANLDPFAEAIAKAETVGATLTTFAANPADALILSKLKESTTSSRPLLGTDPTEPTIRRVQGVQLLISPAVPAGTIWGIPQDRTYVIRHPAAELGIDRSVFFTSDRVAVRATMRVAFGYAHPAAMIKISLKP